MNLKKLKFYLVGPIQWAEDFMSWREDIKEFLEECGHEALFPWGEIYHGKKGKAVFSEWVKEMSSEDCLGRIRTYMRRFVLKWDLQAVDNCDGIIFWLPKDLKTVGSYGEETLIYYFVYHKKYKKYIGRFKRIFIVTDIPLEEMSYWMIGCSDRIFKSFDEFKDYFRKNFNKKKVKKDDKALEV